MLIKDNLEANEDRNTRSEQIKHTNATLSFICFDFRKQHLKRETHTLFQNSHNLF
jgi:hypothetical protein